MKGDNTHFSSYVVFPPPLMSGNNYFSIGRVRNTFCLIIHNPCISSVLLLYLSSIERKDEN